MKLHLLKIILFSMLGSSIVFAGGVEEEPGPDTSSEAEKVVLDEAADYDAELTTRENINEYQEIVATLDENPATVCDGDGNVVKWSGGCVTWSGGYIEDGETADTLVRFSN